MSRSGYSDEIGNWELVCWRGAVTSAIRGKRGQAFLKEMAYALDVMPAKRLISDELVTSAGEVCALGAVAKQRSMDVNGLDPEDRQAVSKKFNIAEALAAEIVYENDNEFGYRSETPEQRWGRVRQWVEKNLKESNV